MHKLAKIQSEFAIWFKQLSWLEFIVEFNAQLYSVLRFDWGRDVRQITYKSNIKIKTSSGPMAASLF